MKRKSLDIILTFALILVVISGFGHTWQKANPSVSYGSMGMSADGRIICTVPSTSGPMTSSSFGQLWSPAAVAPPWGSFYLGGAAVSADGSRMFAALSTNTTQQTWIFTSIDEGAIWLQTGFPGTTTATNYCVACSADGMKVIAALGGGSIFYSTNGGLTCSTSSVAHADWTSLASSADGSRMVAGANGGSVYFSSDFGASWTPGNLPAQAWLAVCTSAGGQWVGAASSTRTYVSSDSGAHWLTNLFAGRSIACSANGTNWVISSAQIETSTDGGNTWQTNLAPAQWNGVAVSADGCFMVAQGSGQGTWTGRLTPAPLLNIQSQNTNVTISWLLPSTNLVLQQSADVIAINWATVTNGSMLNFTNLNQQVSLRASGSNTFFRLMAQ
jgi:hypothetical protein